MPHPMQTEFSIYGYNMTVLNKAITDAGGSLLMVHTPEFQCVLSCLAANKIVLDACKYEQSKMFNLQSQAD